MPHASELARQLTEVDVDLQLVNFQQLIDKLVSGGTPPARARRDATRLIQIWHMTTRAYRAGLVQSMAGVTQDTIINWTKHNYYTGGAFRQHKGREIRFFSLLDGIQLAILGMLSHSCRLPFAGAVAHNDLVRERILRIAA